MTSLSKTTFVVTDTETTGLRPGPNRVIEIGAVKVRNGQILDRFEQFVNPGVSVPRQITRLTGITTAMVYRARPPTVVLSDFLDFLGDDVFVGHNAAFDRKFLQFELRKAGFDFRIGSAVCTRRMALRILHALPSRSLSSLMRHYGITAKRRHRAFDDALATAQVFIRLLTALQNETGMETVDELLRFQHSRHEKHRSLPTHVRRIRSEVLPILPEVPGVYLFKNSAGRLLYVGKARDIRARVRTYFVGVDTHPLRIRRLVKAVRDIDFVPTPTELSALILESNLIKSYHPSFNRAEVRYRNLPFVRIDDSDPARAVSWSFEIHPDGAAYYGPLHGRNEADTFVRIARRHPSIFSDGFEVVREKLEEEMRGAADRLDFEAARALRDDAAFLRSFCSRPYRTGFSVLDHNAVWIGQADKDRRRTVLSIKRGRLAGNLTTSDPPTAREMDEIRSAIVACCEPSEEDLRPYRRKEVDEIRIIANWLYRNRDKLAVVPIESGESAERLVAKVEALLAASDDSRLRRRG